MCRRCVKCFGKLVKHEVVKVHADVDQSPRMKNPAGWRAKQEAKERRDSREADYTPQDIPEMDCVVRVSYIREPCLPLNLNGWERSAAIPSESSKKVNEIASSRSSLADA